MRLTRAAALFTIAGCGLGAVVAGVLSGAITPLDGRLYDASLAVQRNLFPTPPPAASVVVVGLDERSLSSDALAAYPRAFLGPVWGRALDALFDAGATVVAFDLIFAYSANQFQPGFDRPFLEALSRHQGRLVLGRSESELPARPFLAAVRFDPGALGQVEVMPDSDGVVRRVPMRLARAGGADPVQSLAAASLAVAGADPPGDQVLLAPRRHLEEIPGYALIDVLDCARNDPGRLAGAVSGRLVFIGTVLPDEDRALPAGRFRAPADRSASVSESGERCRLDPLGHSAPGRNRVPGVYLHAAAAETVLSGALVREAPAAWRVAVAGTAAVAGAVIGLLFGPLAAFGLALAGIMGLWAGQIGLLRLDIYQPATFAMTAVGLSTLLAYVVRYLAEDRRRRHIQRAFGQYLSPELVRRLAEAPVPPRLGGERREMTFLFCDVRGFTTLSESCQEDPQALTTLINRFLTAMSRVILEHGGTIDKYMGDCIMAFWNAPVEEPDHRHRACRAALEMSQALGELNRKLETEATGERRPFEPLEFGIGINSGPCIVGNMGSAQRFDYTVLGDAVNLASRLEGLSRIYGVEIVLGPSTAKSVADFALLELDRVAVKGKLEAVTVYALLGDDAGAGEFTALAERHQAMIAAYRSREWARAAELASGLKACAPRLAACYELYLHRIEQFAADPPPVDWDAVHVPAGK